MNEPRFVRGKGSFINIEKLRRLAFENGDLDRTDRERELRVALQDALVLVGLYRAGDAEEIA